MEIKALAIVLSVLAVLGVASLDAPVVDGLDDRLVLVNRQNRLPYEYVPEGLVLPNVTPAPRKGDAIYLCADAAKALENLFEGAAEAGHTLYAVSGYRSYALQKSIYNRKVEQVGEKAAGRVVAMPGRSEHQLGLAMDINGESTVSLGLVQKFGEAPEGLWVAENAHHYGFIIRYPKDQTDITGYTWEPWHLRYVGISVAKEVYRLGITFEEYHALLQQRRIVSQWASQGIGGYRP